jgi:hypothetical protein
MGMAVIVCAMAVVIIVAVIVLVPTGMVVVFSMRLCVRSALVLQPELWYCVSDYTSESAEFAQCISNAILEIVW